MKRITEDNEKGFTLTELIVVLAILGIIMLIIIPLYPALTHRMKVNTDRSSAANIADAVKCWYSDCSTDEQLKEFSTELQVDTTIRFTEVTGLSRYLDVINTKPCSLLNENKVTEPLQEFFIGMIKKEDEWKVVVSIGTSGSSITSDSVENYDGNSSGIIYIER